MEPPVVTVSSEGGWYAYSGVRVAAVADLSDIREYESLDESSLRRKLLDEQRSFLGSFLGLGTNPIEMRWLWEPTVGRYSIWLLTRAFGSSRDEALGFAQRTARLFHAAPQCVFIEDITQDELAHALLPLAPAAQGSYEIRKQIVTARPQRPDAGVQYYLTIPPYPGNTRDWTPLLRVIASQQQPVVLSTSLTPITAGASFLRTLEQVGSSYQRLATESQAQTRIHGGKQILAADPFAVEAQQVFADARRRYASGTFRMRVAVYSDQPLDPAVATSVGATIARDDRHDNESYLSAQAGGTAFQIAAPGPTQVDDYRNSIHSLTPYDWEPDQQPSSAAVPASLQPLSWLVDTEEATTAFRLPAALAGTLPGVEVRSRAPGVVVHYEASGPSLTLGKQTTNSAPLAIQIDDLTQHALLLGTTGSGKTNTSLALLRQLWSDHRIPFMVIEPVNEERDDYRWLATLPGFEELLVFTVGEEAVAPFRLNPFEVPTGVRVSTHVANLLACFDAAFGLWDPLPIIYRKALQRTYTSRGIDPNQRSAPGTNWPSLPDFVDAMEKETSNLDYAGEVRSNIIAASTLRVGSLADGPCGATLGAPNSFPIETLLSRPVVVELAAVGDDPKEQSLITALLLTSMTEFYKAGRESSDLQHVTVIEEAHRLLGRPTPGASDTKQADAQAHGAERFANTLAENRKYGEALMVIDQDPSKLIPDAYKNTNLKIMHRLPSEDDRRTIGDTMRFNSDQKNYASTLNKMQGYAYHARLDRPALIDVPDVRAQAAAESGLTIAPLATNDELRNRHETYVGLDKTVQAALAAQGSCGLCRSRCWLETAAEERVRPHVDEFKERLNEYPGPRPPERRREWWEQLFDNLRVNDPGADLVDDNHGRAAITAALLRLSYPKQGQERRAKWMEQLQRHGWQSPGVSNGD